MTTTTNVEAELGQKTMTNFNEFHTALAKLASANALLVETHQRLKEETGKRFKLKTNKISDRFMNCTFPSVCLC